ncbi:MAG: hypothetical protein LBR36_01165 [Bacteroidales bacterium]|nr:hypothetical protein [Bacteroidales bacterium]
MKIILLSSLATMGIWACKKQCNCQRTVTINNNPNDSYTVSFEKEAKNCADLNADSTATVTVEGTQITQKQAIKVVCKEER